MASGYFTRRTETCKQVLSMLQDKGLVMMRAPPRSGKPSLCQLVAVMAKASNVFQQVFYLSCAAVDQNVSFSIQFHRKCGVTFDEAAQQASASNRTVIVIDKAQRTYNTAASLWKWAKDIVSSPSNPQWLMILTASSHGSNPLASMGYTPFPVEFAATRSIVIRYSLTFLQYVQASLIRHLLPKCYVIPQYRQALCCCRRSHLEQPALQFTDSEFNEVFNSFCERKKLQLTCVQTLKDYIGNMTEKQPGLVLHMLDVLDVITNYADNSTEYMARAQNMFLDETFLSNLQNVRELHEAMYCTLPPCFLELMCIVSITMKPLCCGCCAALSQPRGQELSMISLTKCCSEKR
ncbi:hypothetical protein MMC14_009536 [Varicellaria rhodocarpa]|nr:hypothetical protein [Varicellaria rhodocarpa]